MSVISNSIHDFEASLQAPFPPPNVNHATAAHQQVSQLEDNPTMSQTTTLLVTMLNESKHEAKQSRELLSQHLHTAMNTVAQHDTVIHELKGNVKTTGDCLNKVATNQTDIINRLAAVEVLAKNTNAVAAETKQRSVKGNFILSGDLIPQYSLNEDLYRLLFPIIYQKYGICIYLSELKALHRLPNNKVIFTLLTRLPGQNFDNLMRAVNGNPTPHLKLFLSSQLMPPYSELYYIARRLKHHQISNRYRLDENGITYIALAEHLMAFKFTGFEQLRYLNIRVPQPLLDEVRKRTAQIKESEARSIVINNKKAKQQRLNYTPRNPGHPPIHAQQSGPLHPSQGFVHTSGQTAQRQLSVPAPLVPPPNVLRHPPPNLSPGSSTPTSTSSQLPTPIYQQQRSPVNQQEDQTPSFYNPYKTQTRAQMHKDGRPPAPKYQRPSYSPTAYPNPASFLTSPPPGTTPPHSKCPVPSPGTTGSSYTASGPFYHTDPSTHRVNQYTYHKL